MIPLNHLVIVGYHWASLIELADQIIKLRQSQRDCNNNNKLTNDQQVMTLAEQTRI